MSAAIFMLRSTISRAVIGVFSIRAVAAAKAKLPPSVITGNPQGRGVPDIAGNASPYSGYDLILYGESTTKLKLTAPAKGVLGVIGGTSAVAPLYAALIALINADLDEPLELHSRRERRRQARFDVFLELHRAR